jgi:hypothetical protein
VGIKANLVLVEWHDAHSDSSWEHPAEVLEAHKPAIAFSVGWVLKQDKVGISLFASVIDGELIGEKIFIPAPFIKKVTVLKKARQ